jgi:tetratricopeptide (TPR) repeat protein
MALLEANLARDARLAFERKWLRNAHNGRALALTDLNRHTEALQDWERALALDQGPDRAIVQLGRALTLTRAGRHAEAVKDADNLTRNEGAPSSVLYLAACVYAAAVAGGTEDAALQEQYGRNALALLRRAHAAGHFQVPKAAERLRHEEVFAPLRDQADFKQLLADLEAERGK